MRTGLGILPAQSQRRQVRIGVLSKAAAAGARSKSGETHPPVVSEVSICSLALSMATKCPLYPYYSARGRVVRFLGNFDEKGAQSEYAGRRGRSVSG